MSKCSKYSKSVALALAPKVCVNSQDRNLEKIAHVIEAEMAPWFAEYEAMKEKLIELGIVKEDNNSYLVIKPLRWTSTNALIAQ